MGSLHLVAGPHAAGTEDAAHMVHAEAPVTGIQREAGKEVAIADMIDAKACGQALELAMAVYHADRADVITLGQQQFDDLTPVAPQPFRIGCHHHPLFCRCYAGGLWLFPPRDLHHAESAPSPGSESFKVTEGGEIEPV